MKRIRIIVLLVALIALGGLATAIFRTREPGYQGRTLTEWIKTGREAEDNFRKNPFHDVRDTESDPAWQAASHAVKQIGTNAMPFLLEWARAEDSRPVATGIFSKRKWMLINWVNAHPFLHIHIASPNERTFAAITGFRLLGKEANAAWPALANMTNSKDWAIRYHAFLCMVQSNADKEAFLPVLLRLIHDPQSVIARMAAYEFHTRYPQDARAVGLYKMFPNLEDEPTQQAAGNRASEKR